MPEVQDATGATWNVKRRWLPWKPRPRDVSDFATGEDIDAFGDDPISLVIGLIFAIAILPILIVIGVFLAEILLLLLVIPVAMLLRIAFIRSWPIEVWQGKRLMEQESVKGWRASSERIHDLVNEIRLRHSPGESATA